MPYVRDQHYGDWLSDLVGGLKQVIPKGTIVGNLIGSTTPKASATAATPVVKPPTTQAGVGSFLAGNQGVLILGGVALLALFMFMQRRAPEYARSRR